MYKGSCISQIFRVIPLIRVVFKYLGSHFNVCILFRDLYFVTYENPRFVRNLLSANVFLFVPESGLIHCNHSLTT